MPDPGLNTSSRSHTIARYSAIATVLLFGPLFIMFTNPTELPLPFVVIPFVWLFVALYVVVYVIAGRTSLLASRKRRQITAGVSASLPVLLLVLGSLHQLTVKDFVLVGAIIGLVTFYMARADFI